MESERDVDDVNSGATLDSPSNSEANENIPTLESGTELEPQSPALSETEQLLQSLNQLNATLSPLAVGDDNCNNANPGTGAYAETLCWLDFTGFTTAYRNVGSWLPNWQSVMGSQYTAGGRIGNWGNIQNYEVNMDLGGGYVLRADLDVTGNNNAGKQVVANSFPTWSGAFLGNRNFYSGVGGRPALYQTGNGGDTSLTLKNIELERDGTLLRDYSIVVADAESTDTNESIDWTTTGEGFRWLPNTPPGGSKLNVMGNACSTASPAWNSSTPTAQASCKGGASGNKTGTAMLATAPPSTGSFQITQQMKGNGLQGVAFGVIIARAAVQTSVTDRIVNSSNQAADQTNFSGTILQTIGNTQIATTETGTNALQSPEGTSALPVSTLGTQLRFTSVASGSLASSYRSAWRCERTNPANGTTSYWPSQTTTSPTPPAPSDPFTLLSVGQYLKCNIEYTPPYLTLLKEVDNGATAATHTAADFTLQATRQVSPVSMIRGPGNQAAAVTKRAVATGQYALQENGPNPETQGNWPYGYDWANLVCAPQPGSTALGAFALTSGQDGTVAAGSLQINPGNNIVCTYRNVAREPQLEAEKEVFDASGNVVDRDSVVNANETISYKLTFRNSGTAAMELDYRDYLGDVLDDAQFVTNSVRISNGEETAYPNHMDDPGIVVTEQLNQLNPQLGITGTVQRAQTRTVWFRVTVLSNQDNAGPRQEGIVRSSDEAPNQVGYMLSNYLLPAGSPVPQACPEPAPGEPSSCTQHPVPAWSVAKDSRPADGARLHKGGNTHYQIIATKMNAATPLEDLVFEDDLTHVFKTAGWAPGAAVPGGALKRGIYFFDENDQALDAAGEPVGTVAVPVAAFDENSGYVPEPTFHVDTGRWIIRSLPVTLPVNAVRAEMWFAVEAGQLPANIPSNWPEDSNPAFGSKYVNYVRAQAQDALLPNQCSLATTNAPNTGFSPTAPIPQDVDFPEACRVIHQMSDNYFTIRKDARGAGVEFPDSISGWGDSTGLTNMVGHEFEIRDDQGGAPTDHPSVKLCRAEYNPTIWDGNFISGGTPDWGEDSATLAAIIAHNNTLPAGSPNELPLCGLFYPQGTFSGQPHAGGQDGRWRSEYLSEGDYWLVETKAPELQINNAGTERRPVPGVQLLAQPIGFRVWPEADAPYFGTQNPQQSMEGRGQLDIEGLEQDRCSPGAPVGERPVACVNPTGYLMIVQDVVPITMPLTGGKGTTWLIVAGSGVITASVIGLWLWRRNQSRRIIGGENPM
ncbi:DUF7927 domain-containing protein [Corynebacterium gallinarum]|uniref:LPXTG cell wall anchor domain-containing protein n=1 Tax=Corynebacterium gallinarum TaxID=2762214 RepID=A0A8I0HDY7_9CORY|nr:LPXTG cell wall anchor domain-containing protein [Corynebacterium gallinarum]MBD8029996.1 LPXTG cell wall anchor domain-containing protein [Corynebacterium gallinarum]